MKNLVKVALVATAFVFAVGCAKKAPAPVAPQPVVADTSMVQPEPVVKKHKRYYKDKLGKVRRHKDRKK